MIKTVTESCCSVVHVEPYRFRVAWYDGPRIRSHVVGGKGHDVCQLPGALSYRGKAEKEPCRCFVEHLVMFRLAGQGRKWFCTCSTPGLRSGDSLFQFLSSVGDVYAVGEVCIVTSPKLFANVFSSVQMFETLRNSFAKKVVDVT